MNRGILLLLFLFLVGVRNGVKAQELQVSDISCRPTHDLTHVGDDAIEVIKEGSNLRIVLGLYQCNPFVTGFDVKATMRKGSENTLDSLSVRIDPVIPDSLRNMNVMQQCYHVMFTIHEVEDASVFFSCLWYEGEVELKQSVVIKDSEVAVTVDDVDYYIYEAKHYATLINGKSVKGELAIPYQYDTMAESDGNNFHEGLCAVVVDGSHEWVSYIDKTGKLAFEGVFSYGGDFSEGLAAVTTTGENARSGYIDHDGKMVIELPDGWWGRKFTDGVAQTQKVDSCYIIDKTGQRLFKVNNEITYTGDDIRYSEGLAVVYGKGKFEKKRGFMDKTGRITFCQE